MGIVAVLFIRWLLSCPLPANHIMQATLTNLGGQAQNGTPRQSMDWEMTAIPE